MKVYVVRDTKNGMYAASSNQIKVAKVFYSQTPKFYTRTTEIEKALAARKDAAPDTWEVVELTMDKYEVKARVLSFGNKP